MNFVDLLPSILMMLALISVLIIAHELGHFYVARRCGVKVERFGFGLPFGPTLWSKKFGETEYCIHAFLFGGYVSFPDDSPDSPIPMDSTERFENQPVWNRAAIAVAGVTVNAILAWAIMVGVIGYWGVPKLDTADIGISKILTVDAPAAKAGLQAGDIIVGIEGKKLDKKVPVPDRWAQVSDVIYCHPNKPVDLEIRREGKLLSISVVPDANRKIGVQFSYLRDFVPVSNIFEAFGESTVFLWDFMIKNFQAIGGLFSNIDAKQLGGPIRIVGEGSQMINIGGIQEGLIITAAVSLTLAVMNLLPIPALDGGHLLFILIEGLKGSPVRKELQERIIQGGFLALMALMVFILYNDVNNMFFDNQPKVERKRVCPPDAAG
jgi:membrane-associated protease RseP (regulator of RpoE activity)